jgi:hypothetical protein
MLVSSRSHHQLDRGQQHRGQQDRGSMNYRTVHALLVQYRQQARKHYLPGDWRACHGTSLYAPVLRATWCRQREQPDPMRPLPIAHRQRF